jgi:hypothetical protein
MSSIFTAPIGKLRYILVTDNDWDKVVEAMGEIEMEPHYADDVIKQWRGSVARTHIWENDEWVNIVVRYDRQREGNILQKHAVLAHEAMHIVQEIFRHVGEEAPGDEVQAYFLQEVCYNLFTEFQEQTSGE